MARLHAVVVLPSSGWLLVTAITRACPAPAVNTSDVRSERNASPKSCGTVSDSSGTRLPRIAGTSPSSGSPRRLDTSSGVFTVSSRYSIPNASPNATSSPAIIAVNHSRRVFGENGAPGTSARSITCTLFDRLLLTTCSSFCCCSSDCHSWRSLSA